MVSSSLAEPNGLRAVELANQFKSQGKETGIYLMQNAVLGVLVDEVKTRIESSISSGIALFCQEEDLSMRGLKREDLHPEIHISNYSALIDLMMETYDKVIGVF